MLKPFILFSIVLLFAQTQNAVAAGDQWTEVRSDHFTLATNASEKDGRHVLDQLERMRWVFQTLFPKLQVDPAEPIVVIAAKNQKTFQTIEPAAYLAKGQLQLGGLFQRAGDKNYVLLRMDSPDEQHPYAAIYHEYTHLQMGSATAWLPLWFNEGFAEFVQNTQIRNKDVLLGMPDPNELMLLRQSRMIPLDVLFRVDHNSPYYHEEDKGNIFYAESWALMHYLEITDRERGLNRVSTYLSLIARHTDSVDAARQAFGDLKQLEKDLGMYTVANDYKQFVLKSAMAPIDEAAFKARALTALDADALRADVLASVGRKDEAVALDEAVLKADPENAQALETRGMMAFRDGDHDQARGWYDRAVKTNAQSFLAWYYNAMLNHEVNDSGRDAQIEAALRKAIELNPRFAPAMDALGVFLGQRHKNLDESRSLSEKAIQLEPGNFAYRLNEAGVLESNGKLDDAEAVLKAALAVARSANNQSILRNRLDELDRYRKTQAEIAKAQAENETEPHVIETAEPVKADSIPPAHPAMSAKGPHHTITGVMRKVVCGYPTTIELTVEGTKKSVRLYNNNFVDLDLSAVGFTPSGSMNPCKEFEGLKAVVQYVDTTDKSIDGQVISVEMHK